LIQSFFRIGAKLMTLRAATFITELPRRSTMPKNGKMEMLLLVAERDGPEMLTRIGVMRALNLHSAKATPAPRLKRTKTYWLIRRSRQQPCE
jgi:hypothetical protein